MVGRGVRLGLWLNLGEVWGLEDGGFGEFEEGFEYEGSVRGNGEGSSLEGEGLMAVEVVD